MKLSAIHADLKVKVIVESKCSKSSQLYVFKYMVINVEGFPHAKRKSSKSDHQKAVYSLTKFIHRCFIHSELVDENSLMKYSKITDRIIHIIAEKYRTYLNKYFRAPDKSMERSDNTK